MVPAPMFASWPTWHRRCTRGDSLSSTAPILEFFTSTKLPMCTDSPRSASGRKMRIGSHTRPTGDACAVGNDPPTKQYVATDKRVIHPTRPIETHAFTDLRPSEQHDTRPDDDVTSNANVPPNRPNQDRGTSRPSPSSATPDAVVARVPRSPDQSRIHPQAFVGIG